MGLPYYVYLVPLVCKVIDFTGNFICYRVRTSCRVQQRTAATAVVKLKNVKFDHCIQFHEVPEVFPNRKVRIVRTKLLLYVFTAYFTLRSIFIYRCMSLVVLPRQTDLSYSVCILSHFSHLLLISF